MRLREFRLLLIGVGAIIVSVAVVGFVIPEFTAYRNAMRSVKLLADSAQDGSELAQLLDERNRKIEEVKFLLHGDMANLPIKQVEAYIIGRLQKISWRNRVELASVEPATGERVQIFREVLFNVKLVGEYNDLYRWLWDARSELGFVVVKEYALSRRDSIDEDPRLSATLSLASYRVEE
jgi:hypothetical protein